MSSPAARYTLERTLEEIPTWSVAVVFFVIIVVSIFIEHLIHLCGHWLQSKHKAALYEALEKIKAELMLLGFISLLLTVIQGSISDICVSEKVADSWHPCAPGSMPKRATYTDYCYTRNKVAFLSRYGIHQLHIFIFVLALVHVLYCIITLALGRTKMRRWKIWEDETKRIEYMYSNDPERFRFTRDTSFGRRHLHFWSQSTVLLWIVCIFRQFIGSVITKVDYLTLRHGFIMAHLAPESETKFDFHKYINRSLEEDFKVVVGISPILWFSATLFFLSNTYGLYSYLWLPFIPLIIILLVGAKLQVIITKMGLRIQERGDIVKGAPLVQPGDDLFWFGKPRFMLFLIHFVLFQNAFQLAFFSWSTYAFSIHSCFHRRTEDIVIRISMGVIIQVLCSYVTLPLYALVTQMGSTMKPTIFNERVATALKKWHHTAKKNTKQSKHSETNSPFSSRPATPSYGMSPVHLLHNYRSSTAPDSYHNSPHFSNNVDHEFYDRDGSTSPHNIITSGPHNNDNINDDNNNNIIHDHRDIISEEMRPIQHDRPASSSSQHHQQGQHEVKIGVNDFSFGN